MYRILSGYKQKKKNIDKKKDIYNLTNW